MPNAPDTVKVELQVPEPVHRAIEVVCESFCQDPSDYMIRSIIGGIERDLNNNFESYNDLFSKRIENIMKELEY